MDPFHEELLAQVGPPRVGYYKLRLKPSCPWVPARVWKPTATEDRSYALRMHVLGNVQPDFALWPRCFPCSETEYQALMAEPPADPYEWTTRGANAAQKLAKRAKAKEAKTEVGVWINEAISQRARRRR